MKRSDTETLLDLSLPHSVMHDNLSAADAATQL
jgi:hypothetical protein